MSTGKEVDMTSTAADLFMAPSTHCEGGEDAAILVEVGSGDEGQHLISARVDGSAKKRLCPVSSMSTCVPVFVRIRRSCLSPSFVGEWVSHEETLPGRCPCACVWFVCMLCPAFVSVFRGYTYSCPVINHQTV